MSEKITLKLECMETLYSQLKELPNKVGKKIMRQALRAGAKIVLAKAKANAPTLTGQLKNSLKVRAGKRKRDRVSYLVQTAEGDFKGDTFYGAINELGRMSGTRKSKNRHKIEGTHFMLNAYEQTQAAALDTITQTIKDGLEEQ